MTEEIKKTPTRSEREAAIKDRAGLVIVVMALFLALNTYYANSFSGQAMTNLIEASDTYSFFQAKSIKQSIAEGQLEEAKDPKRKAELQKKIDRYESDPKTKEGKKELLAKAQALKDARNEAKLHSPWLTFSGMLFQLAIVLLSASIIAVDMRMYWGSWGVGGLALLLMTQGIWLWF
jgi:nitrogen fixation protein FixH